MHVRDWGVMDTSEAALVVIDGHELKEESDDSYRDLVFACSSLLYKYTNHKLFAESAFNNEDGGLVTLEGKHLERKALYYQGYANFAIDEFNRLRKDMKLQLVKLFRANIALWCDFHIYMTFSALDELSGNTATYQAALIRLTMGKQVLGFFRDDTNDKVLAILSITGAEEDLPVPANKKASESDLQKSDYGVELSECRELKRFTRLGISSGNITGSGSAVGLKALLV